MKNLTVLLLVCFVLHSHAQITLTAETSIPEVGQTLHILGQMQPTIQVNHSGANQTWDFSGITPTAASFSYFSPSSTGYYSSFPNSTIAEFDGSNYNFYSNTADAYYLDGQVFPSGSILYSDKREVLRFPITYNDIFNETFAGNVNGFDRSGNIKIHADGYGSLILPYTTVPDVLKITASFNYSDFYEGTEYYTYVDTIQMWYHIGNKTQIASRSVGYYNGIKYISNATYIAQSDLANAITPAIDAVVNSDLYVTINKGVLHIQSTQKIDVLEIYSLQGNKVLSVSTPSSTIPIDNLTSGFYIVKAKSHTKEYINKVLIK